MIERGSVVGGVFEDEALITNAIYNSN